MARGVAILAAIAVSLLAVSGAGGAGAQTPKRGGTVVVGPLSEPKCLSPLLEATCAGGLLTYYWIAEKVSTPTFATTPDFTKVPALVSRVSFTRTQPFILTYYIRPEARWSDGVPVSARDFLFTYRAKLRYPELPENDAYKTVIRSVRSLDAKTVRVVLRSRFANWRGLFSAILPEHALRGEDLARVWIDGITSPKTGRPIGNGPFLVERWNRGEQLVLTRNPRYWGLHPAYLDRLIVRFCQACTAPPPAEVLEGLRSGGVDLALSRDTGIVPELRRLSDVTVFPFQSNGWEHLSLRLGTGGHPALRNKLVRRAIAYGIDRHEIVRRLFGEIATGYQPSQSAVFLNTRSGYESNWRNYSYQPDRARDLLERAGCRRGQDGIYSCGGERLSLRLMTIAGARQRERGLDLIAPQLRRVGIEVVLGFAPSGALFSQILPRGDFDVVSFAWFALDEVGGEDVYGCGGVLNWTGYCQRLATRDLDQAGRILDARERASCVEPGRPAAGQRCPRAPALPDPLRAGVPKGASERRPRAEQPLLERGELVARGVAILAAIAVSLLTVSGASGAGAQNPKRGGTVVVAIIPPEPACLNYLLGARCGPATAAISVLAAIAPVLEAPFDAGSGYTWRPKLVSRVDVRTKPPFTLTYHIRPEAKWSDGVPVTAGDFIFTLRALRRFDPEDSRAAHRSIRSIRALDAKTIRLVLRPRYADWRSFFGSVLPSHALRNQNLEKVWIDGIVNPKTGAAIGSGPFLVEKWERGRELVLRRNANYWGPHRAHVERLVLRFGVDGNDLLDGFQRGELDVAYGFTPPFLPALRRSGLAVHTTRGAGFDTSRFVSQPVAILRSGTNSFVALSPIASIVPRSRASFSPMSTRGSSRCRAPFTSTVPPTTSPNWRGYSSRPERARRLLEEAGCVRGADGIYSCGGERLSIRVSSPSIPGSIRVRALELVQPQLRQVGDRARAAVHAVAFPLRPTAFERPVRDGHSRLDESVAVPGVRQGHLRLRRGVQLDGLLPAACDEGSRSGGADPRCEAACAGHEPR